MIKFYKVSFERFKEDLLNSMPMFNALNDKELRSIYDDIELPKRATKTSAGYDFYAPISLFLSFDESVRFPTGIRAEMDDNVVLLLAPRSSLGFKHQLTLDNTLGVIDSDYFYAENEGHIQCKMHCKGSLEIYKGQAYMQGIFINYLKTDDDSVSTTRTGGIGSTSK